MFLLSFPRISRVLLFCVFGLFSRVLQRGKSSPFSGDPRFSFCQKSKDWRVREVQGLRSRRPASTGVSRALRARVSRGVSPKTETLGTHFGHSGARGPKGPGDTRDTLHRTPVLRDTLGDNSRDTRARRARETPVAGRRDRKSR